MPSVFPGLRSALPAANPAEHRNYPSVGTRCPGVELRRGTRVFLRAIVIGSGYLVPGVRPTEGVCSADGLSRARECRRPLKRDPGPISHRGQRIR